jgi:hypothetical protein
LNATLEDEIRDNAIIASMEEDGIDTQHLSNYDEDSFYCMSENRVYSNEQLYEKFNIKETNYTDAELESMGYGYLS